MPAILDNSVAACRQRLIQAASEAFMEEGYRVSVERIAARAGVAKQTLYNHFKNKEALFADVVRTAVQSILVALETGSGDLRAQLIRFAIAYRAKILCPSGLAMFRAIISEASRFPDLSRHFFVGGPQTTVRQLAAFIENAMARGDLRNDDPELAAEMLTGMLSNYDRLRGLINGGCEQPPDTDKAERAVDCFLRAYAPN